MKQSVLSHVIYGRRRSSTASGVFSPFTLTFTNSDFQDSENVARRTSFAKTQFETTAEWITITFSNQSAISDNYVIGVWVDGTFFTKIAPTATTNVVTKALPLGRKTIELVDSAQVSTTQDGSLIVSVEGYANIANKISPVIREQRLCGYGDSILMGFGSTNPTQKSWSQLVERNYYIPRNYGITVIGAGSRELWNDGATAATRQTFINRLASILSGTSRKEIWYEIGINDWFYSNWGSSSSFQAAYTDLLTKTHKTIPDARVFAQSMNVYTNELLTNSLGETVSNYRTAVSASVTTFSGSENWLKYVNGAAMYTSGQLADTVHPNDSGHLSASVYALNVLTSSYWYPWAKITSPIEGQNGYFELDTNSTIVFQVSSSYSTIVSASLYLTGMLLETTSSFTTGAGNITFYCSSSYTGTSAGLQKEFKILVTDANGSSSLSPGYYYYLGQTPIQVIQSLNPLVFHCQNNWTINTGNLLAGDQVSSWTDLSTNGYNSVMPYGTFTSASQPTICSGTRLIFSGSTKTPYDRLSLNPSVVTAFNGATYGTLLVAFRRTTTAGIVRPFFLLGSGTNNDYGCYYNVVQRPTFGWGVNGAINVYGNAVPNSDLNPHIMLCRHNTSGATAQDQRSIFMDTGTLVNQTWSGGTAAGLNTNFISGSIGASPLTDTWASATEIEMICAFTRSLSTTEELKLLTASRQILNYSF